MIENLPVTVLVAFVVGVNLWLVVTWLRGGFADLTDGPYPDEIDIANGEGG